MTDQIIIKAIVNGEHSIEFTDNAIKDFDVLKLSDNEYQLLYQHKNFKISIIEKKGPKEFQVLINGNIYTVDLKNHLDLMVEKLGLATVAKQKLNEIKAPMPGLVLDVFVSNGQKVSKGDNLLILEAMKMENVLKAPDDGIIDEIKIAKGTIVEKNQILITLK